MGFAKSPYPEKEAKQAFFKLMLAGFATDAKSSLVPRFQHDLGTNRTIWQDDNTGWLGIDEWRTSPRGDGSNDTTSLYHRKDLLWEMQYGGAYPKQAIPFLQKALLQAYTKHIWLGGRGLEGSLGGGYVYYNNPHPDSHFSKFNGQEYIIRTVDGKQEYVGTHTYHGGWLY